jgi:signal transduction histidine kinase
VVIFARSSPSGVSPKIVCRREARAPGSDENGIVHLLDRGRFPTAVIVAAALAAAYVARLPSPAAGGGFSKSSAIVLNVLAFVPLIVARRWPSFAAAAATLVTLVALRAYDAPLTVASFGVTLFALAHLVIRRGLLVASPLILPFVVFAVTRLHDHKSALASTAPLLFLMAALAVGESIRRRGLAVAALDATQEAMAESIRARTVMEERARIARELHDIVAHHLSVIAIESEAARLTSPGLSADAGGRLEAIASTAREALTETRRLLGVLREDTGTGADRAPQPGLAELDDLIDRARATGTHIRLERDGKVEGVPLSIDLAAYRIVQEALTNARRHAPGADVDVQVSFRDRALHLRVRDHGPGALGGQPVAGHGLMGMRERATLAGGTFSWGPADGGGFEVDVTLPAVETAP